MTLSFSLTWDYRCPFARIAHRHVCDALLDGADWDVNFVPFCLGQVHVGEGEAPIWDHPEDDTGLLALQAAVVVRDARPDAFVRVHRALFEARHAEGAHLRHPEVVAGILESEGVDPGPVFDEIDTGTPLKIVRDEHTAAATDHDVWGVPTFIAGDRAAFVRLMELPADAADARATVERTLDLLQGWPALNEFKHTSLDR